MTATPAQLSERWTPLKPHNEQSRLWNSRARFRVVPAGRRSGKTELAKRRLVIAALEEPVQKGRADCAYFAAAPTRDQAKRIFWDDLKLLVPSYLRAGAPRETDLCIKLVTGSTISVVGMDKPERIEGSPWDGGILDENGNMKAQTWPQHVRPALSDRHGWCWLIGVPEGRNHYYDQYKFGLADSTGEWAAFTWHSSTVLPSIEIAAAKRDLDELTFQQEYEASFVNFEGRTYYGFSDKLHCARLAYSPMHPLIFCFDFNVEPGVAAVCQEQRLPNGQAGTGIIGEVHIPRNSNTPAVCKKLINDWGKHQGQVRCYGDATGGARGTAKVSGSDWDLIKEAMRGHYGQRVSFRVPRANPPERSRVNAVNSRILTGDGTIRLMVDPSKAPHVVKDFEGVQNLKGGSGEIDKKSTPALSHLTDGCGYYIFKEFPLRNAGVQSQELPI